MNRALVDALVPIFVGLLLGYYAGRRGWMDNVNLRNLVALVMTVCVPSALAATILRTSREALMRQGLTSVVIAIAFCSFFVVYYAGSRWSKMSVEEASIIALTFSFPNSAAMAVALLSSTFGAVAGISGALSIAVGSVTVSPITLALLEAREGASKTSSLTAKSFLTGVGRSFKRPVVWAPIAALILTGCNVQLPSYAMKSLDVFGAAATGTALLLTGLVLSAQAFQMNAAVLITAFGKLIAQPLLALAIAWMLGMNQEQIRAITLICAIPGGFFGLVFGKSYNVTPQVASSGLIATYILSIVTLPLWILILHRFI